MWWDLSLASISALPPVSSPVNSKHRQLVTLISTSMSNFTNIQAPSSSWSRKNLTTYNHSSSTVTLFFLDTFKRSKFCLLITVSRPYNYMESKYCLKKVFAYYQHATFVTTSSVLILFMSITTSSIWFTTSSRRGFPPTATTTSQHYKSIFGRQKYFKYPNMHHKYSWYENWHRSWRTQTRHNH